MATVILIGAREHATLLTHACELIVARGHDAMLIDATAAARSANRYAGEQESVRQSVAARYREGNCAGVLGIGDAAGTRIATDAMRALPLGVPKVMLSSVTGDVAQYVDVSDITMMWSVIDLAGLNAISRALLRNAVGALCGMMAQDVPPAEARPLIAATMFGVTTPCVTAVRGQLEAAGYDIIVFHANGAGGRALETLIAENHFVAIADITTTEWADEVVGGLRSAGPDRLGAAARAGIPQVISVGAVDVVNFTTPQTVPEKFRTRTLYRHNPNATLLRTSPEECAEIGRRIAQQLNRASGPVTLLLPLRGLSALDAAGQAFHDPAADAALFAALRENCGRRVRVVEVDAHINDGEFAKRVGEEMLSLLSGSGGTAG